MFKQEFILSCLIITFAVTTACTQSKSIDEQPEPETTASAEQKPHSYGGWYCPDNFGFPPVDLQELDKVPVVIDRLPTKEEASNGTSLIFVDTEKYPDARPLAMKLPRVARSYTDHNGINELIIVIQAVVIGTDTVVGFRYLDGGNGSARISEVTFLSDREVADIGPTPFVYLHTDIKASREKIWEAITQTEFAKELGEKFDKKAFFASDWTDESNAHLNLDTDSVRAAGIVMTHFGNLYMQIDYDYNGFHFAEKLLIGENEDGSANLHIMSGPYPDDFKAQNKIWEKWVKEVKTLSEAD